MPTFETPEAPGHGDGDLAECGGCVGSGDVGTSSWIQRRRNGIRNCGRAGQEGDND